MPDPVHRSWTRTAGVVAALALAIPGLVAAHTCPETWNPAAQPEQGDLYICDPGGTPGTPACTCCYVPPPFTPPAE
jgi:hypothetical protein